MVHIVAAACYFPILFAFGVNIYDVLVLGSISTSGILPLFVHQFIGYICGGIMFVSFLIGTLVKPNMENISINQIERMVAQYCTLPGHVGIGIMTTAFTGNGIMYAMAGMPGVAVVYIFTGLLTMMYRARSIQTLKEYWEQNQ